MARKKLDEEVALQVMLDSKRRCCLCFGLHKDYEIKQGQIAHIDKDPSSNELKNLAFLCLAHHDAYDSRTSQSKGILPGEIVHYRGKLILHNELQTSEKKMLPHNISHDAITGQYFMRKGNNDATVKLTYLGKDKVYLDGIAFWEYSEEAGPNYGILGLEGVIQDDRVVFEEDDYRLLLILRGDQLQGIEYSQSTGHFGMNVSFEGQYNRLKSS